MPQLNPNPWFFIMLTSWLIFSLISQPKLLSFILTPLAMKLPKLPPWAWPWT